MSFNIATDKKYIIDATSIDDTLALILAFKMIRDKVIGITTCGGNIALKKVISNSLKIHKAHFVEARLIIFRSCAIPEN